MVNAKYAVIIAVAAFVFGSFVASPELRAYAANTVFSGDIVDGEVNTADIASNAVTAAKIKDGEVKAAEVAADAIGGSELQGVTKLLFGQCSLTSTEASKLIKPGQLHPIDCSISGVDSDDSAVATMNKGSEEGCYLVERADTAAGVVRVYLKNACQAELSAGAAKISIVVFDK